MRPWCERVLPLLWRQSLPSAVIVPTRGYAQALKGRIAEARLAHLGLRFLTPSGVRELLYANRGDVSPRHEDLCLLLAAAAEDECGTNDEAVQLAAKSVSRSPHHLLRAINRFETAGWQLHDQELEAFAPIVRAFRKLLRDCNLKLIGERDRELARDAAAQPKRFAHVLIIGFDDAHWPLWHLLQAAVDAAVQATVLLHDPVEFSAAETTWIGSWEERFGEAQRLEVAPRRPNDLLFSEEEMRGQPAARQQSIFLVGENAAQQADAIALCCANFVAEPACTRVIVAFSGAGGLPRLVSDALTELGIAHNDSFAHPLPGIFESPEWRAWFDLQRAPHLTSFSHFFHALPNRRERFPEIGSEKLERVLRETYAEMLLDDLEVLRAACAASDRPDEQKVARVLDAFRFLPDRATLREFLSQTDTALQQLGWEQHRTELASRAAAWMQKLDAQIARGLYLRWLQETATSFGAERAATGHHPYARVQLLAIADAERQHCSHLVLAESNEGAWPPPASGEFAREQAIDAFNEQARQLNRRAIRQGRHGEGHTSIRSGYTFYLGPREQREIAQRQIAMLLEIAERKVAFTASLAQQDAPERIWNPSELFTRSYLSTQSEPLTQAAFTALQRQTAGWLNAAGEHHKSEQSRDAIEQTLIAFNARRDPTTPAGEYDFALRPNEPYRRVPALSVSDFEAMVKTPALVWLKRYLGVEATDDDANPWSAATGKWVHRWLATIAAKRNADLFAPFPSPAEIDERVCVSADEKRDFVQRLCCPSGKTLPDWWHSGWQNARYLARHLGGKLASVEEWPWLATELPIGRDGVVTIAPHVSLLLRGQIDLVLAKDNAPDLHGQTVWIVDYKTGSTEPLKPADLHDRLVKGTALQLGLYALALHSLGATTAQMSIVSLAVKYVAPQLDADALAPHEEIFADLAEMQQSRVFGMKGEVRPSFGARVAYPLATLPIDVDVLEDKWALTHPALVLEKEEWEVR